tara:strand:- start:193 stop:633 length:441 start_codon:yes stop_codon:yes gene_type:complete
MVLGGGMREARAEEDAMSGCGEPEDHGECPQSYKTWTSVCEHGHARMHLDNTDGPPPMQPTEPARVVWRDEPEFLPTNDTDSVRVSCVIAARVSKVAGGETLALMTNLDGYAMLGDSRRSVFDVEPGPYQDAWRKRLGLPDAGAGK